MGVNNESWYEAKRILVLRMEYYLATQDPQHLRQSYLGTWYALHLRGYGTSATVLTIISLNEGWETVCQPKAVKRSLIVKSSIFPAWPMLSHESVRLIERELRL